MSAIRVGIVGGTGYTGVELLRLLAGHPQVELAVITSRGEAGTAVSALYPNLRGHCELTFTEPDVSRLAECDLVFFATPHGVAQAMMLPLMERDVRVIDLSADFRLRDAEVWSQWYGQAHAAVELLDEAVYGLPELHREAIAKARLVACPGCYPTAVILAALPLLEQGLVNPTQLIASCASGVSGAGRGAKVATLFAEVNESFKAYGVAGHRHLPEIEQALHDAQGADAPPAQLTFVPHLVPMTRGMQATLYAPLTETVDLAALYAERYRDEPFVDVLPSGNIPETRTVRGSNMCRLSPFEPQQRGMAVICSVIDNLTKGASGQAVQNLNIMFGLPETTGLEAPALLP